MARPRPATQRGLNMEASSMIERRLARIYSKIDQAALQVLRRMLPAVLASRDPQALREALIAVQIAIDNALSDADIARAARKAATEQDNIARRAFFPALAAATGFSILGTDETPGRVQRIPRPPRRPARGRRGTPRLVPKLSFSPTILTNTFVDQNTRLISTLRQGVVEGVRDAVVRAQQFSPDGVLDPDDLAKRLIGAWERNGVPTMIPINRTKNNGEPVLLSARKHARLIARDQIGKLNGQLARTRQTAAGITLFRWMPSTAADPRESHRAFYGKTYTWAEGAPGGIRPGEAINCQCHAQAVIDRDQVLAHGEFVNIDDAGDVFTSRDVVALNPGPGSFL